MHGCRPAMVITPYLTWQPATAFPKLIFCFIQVLRWQQVLPWASIYSQVLRVQHACQEGRQSHSTAADSQQLPWQPLAVTGQPMLLSPPCKGLIVVNIVTGQDWAQQPAAMSCSCLKLRPLACVTTICPVAEALVGTITQSAPPA